MSCGCDGWHAFLCLVPHPGRFCLGGSSYEFDLSSCHRLFDRLEDDGQASALGFSQEHMDVLGHHRRKQVCANLTK